MIHHSLDFERAKFWLTQSKKEWEKNYRVKIQTTKTHATILVNYTSSSFKSIFGIPLWTGNFLPVSGHIRTPSSTWISRSAWWNFWRNSSELSIDESTSTGRSVYPITFAASISTFHSILTNMFRRKSPLKSTSLAIHFDASMVNGYPFVTPFMLHDNMLCVSSLIFRSLSVLLEFQNTILNDVCQIQTFGCA